MIFAIHVVAAIFNQFIKLNVADMFNILSIILYSDKFHKFISIYPARHCCNIQILFHTNLLFWSAFFRMVRIKFRISYSRFAKTYSNIIISYYEIKKNIFAALLILGLFSLIAYVYNMLCGVNMALERALFIQPIFLASCDPYR